MAEQLTGRQQIMARIEVAARLGGQYRAEAQGLKDALHYDAPRSYSADADEQRTYARGFGEGREILRVAGDAAQEVVGSAE